MSSRLSRIQRLSPSKIRSVARSVAEAINKQRTSSSSSSSKSSSIGASAGAKAGVQVGSPSPETPPKPSRTIEQVIRPSPSTSIRPGDIQKDPFQITTTALTPSTRTYTRTVTLPKQEKAKYEGPEYKDVKVDPVKTQFGLREVFTSTPESRRKYVRTRKDYNIQATEYNKQARESIETQKKEIAKYNKAVEEWNKKGRFQTQTFTQDYFPSTTRYEYPEVTFQQREPVKLTTDDFLAKFFKPEALDKKQTPSIISMPKEIAQSILSQAKPDYSNKLIIGQFEAYNPLENVSNPLKRHSFKLQTKIEDLGDKKYIDTGKPLQDTVLGTSYSVASIGVGGYKYLVDIAAFLGDIAPKVDPATGELIKFKDRERVPEIYKPGELTALQKMPVGERIYHSIKTRPEQFVGEALVDLGLFSGIAKAGQLVTSARVRLTSKKIPSEKVFDKSVLQGKSTFPLQNERTIPSNLAEFRKNFEVIDGQVKIPTLHATSSPGRISQVAFTPVTRQGKLLQDPGLYVTPAHRGSPYFLKIQNPELPTFTFNYDNLFKQSSPKLYRVYVSDVKGLPKSVMKGKTYEPVLDFQKNLARQDVAYITKGSKLRTSELEAVIPVDTVLQPLKRQAVLSPYKGQAYYTTYKGKTIPILDVQATRQVTSNIDDVVNVSKSFTNRSERLTQEGIKRLYDSYYYQLANPKIYVSPSVLAPTSVVRSLSSSNKSVSSTSRGASSPVIGSLLGSSNLYNRDSTSERTVTSSKTTQDTESNIITSLIGGESTYTSTSSFLTSTSPSEFSSQLSYSDLSDFTHPLLTKLTTTTPRTILRKKPKSDSKESFKREVNLEDTWIPEYKSKGKWKPIRVDNKKRNYYSAKQLGAYIVDHSVERSFRLRKGRGQADIVKTTRPSIMHKFYKPSKTGNPRLTGAWIEKSKYAIDTPGEKQGITAKGLTALQKQRRKENYLKFLKSKAGTEKYYPQNGKVRTLYNTAYNPQSWKYKKKNKVLTRLLRT